MGRNTLSNGTDAVAMGSYAVANNHYTLALGRSASATGSDGFAIGRNSQAGTNSVAVGRSSVASNSGSFAFGYFSNSTGAYSQTFGYESINKGASSSVIGRLAYNEGSQFALVLGYNATIPATTHTNSIALGRDAVTSRTNQFVIGSSSFPLNTTLNGNLLVSRTASNISDLFSLQDSNARCDFNPETSGVIIACSSDEDLKRDLKNVDGSVIITKWSLIANNAVKDYEVKADGSRQIGPIAQEIIKLDPDLVIEVKNNVPVGYNNRVVKRVFCDTLDDGSKDCIESEKIVSEPVFSEETYYLVKQPNVWELLIFINELKKQNEDLKNKIDSICARMRC